MLVEAVRPALKLRTVSASSLAAMSESVRATMAEMTAMPSGALVSLVVPNSVLPAVFWFSPPMRTHGNRLPFLFSSATMRCAPLHPITLSSVIPALLDVP